MKFLVVLLLFGCLYTCTVCQTGLSLSEKKELLLAHNYYRSIVSPNAADMLRMIWSKELEKVAQQYAEICIFGHNNDRTSQQAMFSYVGENIAITNAQHVNYTALVKRWYDEVQHYDYEKNQCKKGAVCGHYTQVVWATSDKVGCGAYRCKQAVGFDHRNGLNLVCNYGPGGNIKEELPYTVGRDTCSHCSGNRRFCVSNLCSANNDTIGYPTSGGNQTLLNKVILTASVIYAVILSCS